MIKLNKILEAIPKEESTTLYFKEGNSDKVYTATLEEISGGWVVNAQWGRRGSSMQSGTKTTTPVPFDSAKKIYDSLIKSKMAKGYQLGKTEKTSIVKTDKEKRQTGTFPQLLNPISQEEVETYFKSPVWGAQEKYDGKRIIIAITNGEVTGINRKGIEVEIPDVVKSDARILRTATLDGELVGEVYHVFDLLDYENKGINTWPYSRRYDTLKRLPLKGSLELAPLAVGESEKRKLYDILKQNHKEGIVFKNLNAPYTAGRPSKGGMQLKHKFWESATCRVSRINQKRSIGIQVFDNSGKKYVDVGNCTVPPNYPMPEIGDMVEIKYLYVGALGALYQPQYLGVRDDKTFPDKVSQLKYKGISEETDDNI